MNLAAQPIGVFDSGVGGLSVLRALRHALPHERFVYVADSGNAPYGERGDAFVAQRTHTITQFLLEHYGIKALVVACNTATAAAIHEVRTAHPNLPLVGIEPALKPAVSQTHTGRIGVMGTRGTLTSAKFQKLQTSLHGQAEFVIQPCDGLAHAIERSVNQQGGEVEQLCERYIGSMGAFGTARHEIDTLVLGCTHYIFATETLKALVGPSVQIIDTGEPVARQTARLLGDCGLLAQPRLNSDIDTLGTVPRIQLLTTGSLAALRAAAEQWLQVPGSACSDVNLP